MNLLLFCVLYLLIPYLHADPSPDSIQIQNYDGPIFLHAVKPHCCPFCNSLLTQQPVNPEPCDEIPEDFLRKTPRTNDGNFPNLNPFKGGPSNAYIPTTSVNQCETDPEDTCCGSAGNLGAMLHKNEGKADITHSFPLTLTPTGTAGNTFTGTTYPGTVPNAPTGNTFTGTTRTTYPGAANAYTRALDNTYNAGQGINAPPFCGTVPPTVTGTECTCTCVTRPLSSYLPINTSQNNYKLPIVKNQAFGEEEPVLVPQKFSYSLVLDGNVTPFNQNPQCDCRYYCY